MDRVFVTTTEITLKLVISLTLFNKGEIIWHEKDAFDLIGTFRKWLKCRKLAAYLGV